MHSEQQNFSAAELSLIAAAVITIGDGLSTIAAALALQEEQQTPPFTPQQQLNIEQLQRDVRMIKHMLHIR